MGNLILKLRILNGFLSGAFHEWRTEVWKRELDERYCCDGRMCGCGGSTVREVYQWTYPELLAPDESRKAREG